LEHLVVEFEEERATAVAEGVPDVTGGLESVGKPSDGVVLLGVGEPVVGRAKAQVGFVEDDLEEVAGMEGWGAEAGVGVEEGSQVEGIDEGGDATSEVVGVETGVEGAEVGVVVGPVRQAEGNGLASKGVGVAEGIGGRGVAE
jgi:hypothetical protein